MNFDVSPRARDCATAIRAFVEQRLFPLEGSAESYDLHENLREDLLNDLRKVAKELGLWALQVPFEYGGRGFSISEMAVCYEEANRSIFGPACFNLAAPDDGNMILLAKVATAGQRDQWLRPIVGGHVRSAFVMTEPAPGAGSDPGQMLTRADRVPGGWRIYGRKWFITGAAAASHFILIARTSDDRRRGLTAFLFHRDSPGWKIVRRIPIMGPEEHGGHCELEFDGLEVADPDILMGVGDGLKVTQIRLGTARLTHCMRWLGLSRRCLEIGREYVQARTGFGSTLAERESVQLLLAKAATSIEIGRLLTMRAAVILDSGRFARKEVSMAKVHVADALHGAADVALQLNGARGYSKDTIIEWIYRYSRQARLVDGASEVHNMVVSRHFLDEGAGFWQW